MGQTRHDTSFITQPVAQVWLRSFDGHELDRDDSVGLAVERFPHRSGAPTSEEFLQLVVTRNGLHEMTCIWPKGYKGRTKYAEWL